MTIGTTIVKHFDLVNYVLQKYRVMMITEIAEVFRMNVMDMYDVYCELGIDPLEATLKNCIERECIDDDKTGKKVRRRIIKQFLHIKPSPRIPNREPNKVFKRIKGEYSNTSPYGIAKLGFEQNDEGGNDA